MKHLLLGFFLLSLSVVTIAQDGAYDPLFGTNGTTVTDIPGENELSYLIAENVDGSLWAYGIAFLGVSNQNFLVRYLANGNFDTNFGTNGIVDLPISSTFTKLQALPDGSMLVGGRVNSDFLILKYQSDGTQDMSFGTNGVATIDVANEIRFELFPEDNGTITLAGSYRDGTSEGILIARLLANGTLDNSFGTGGINTTIFTTENNFYDLPITRYNDNSFVIPFILSLAGDEGVFGVAKILPDGNIDTAFGDNGITMSNIATETPLYGVATVQSNDNILILLNDQGMDPPFDSESFFIKFLADGTQDTNFGTRSIPYGSFSPYKIIVQENSRLLIHGVEYTIDGGGYTLIRTYANGFIDNSFAQQGRFLNYDIEPGDAIISEDGGIIGCTHTPWFDGPQKLVIFKLLNSPLSIGDNSLQSLTVAPNPSSDIFNINCTQCDLTNQSYIIVDILGKIIKEGTFSNTNDIVDLRDYGSGLYFLKIAQNSLKLIKK